MEVNRFLKSLSVVGVSILYYPWWSKVKVPATMMNEDFMSTSEIGGHVTKSWCFLIRKLIVKH